MEMTGAITCEVISLVLLAETVNAPSASMLAESSIEAPTTIWTRFSAKTPPTLTEFGAPPRKVLT